MSHMRTVCARFGVFAAAFLAAIVVAVPAVPTLAAQQPPAPRAENPNRVLAGAIDIHVHSTPDDRERSVDALDAAKLARANGMRAIVLKNHYDPTAGLAYMVRKQVRRPRGVRRRRLESAGRRHEPGGGRAHDAGVRRLRAHGLDVDVRRGEPGARTPRRTGRSSACRRTASCCRRPKRSSPSIAKHNLVLATGHVSADEGLMLLRDGKRQGVQRMVVTHAMNAPIEMSVAQMQEAAKQGAFIEFVGGTMLSADAPARVDRFADAIRKVGPEFCILSSDLGQKGNPLPADGFAAFILALKARGFSDQDLDRMSKQNPAKLLGLP